MRRGYDAQKLLIEVKNNAEQVLLNDQIISFTKPSASLVQWLQELVDCIDSEGERFFVY
jgi:cell fate (sporulation/competence/biofilm development) regulator YlbF (YheA/YmcA/DUF963 family)